MIVPAFSQIAKQLAANGYEPVPIKQGTKRCVQDSWQQGGFAKRAARFPTAYTGLLTADTPAIDIDVSDADLVRQIHGMVLDVLGLHEAPPPSRVGMAPRMLLHLRTEERFPKISTSEFALPSDPTINGKVKRSKVEILSEGQQFVAYAVHPNTGEPYRWNSTGEPLKMPRNRLPVLNEADAREIVRRADDLLAQFGVRVGATADRGAEQVEQLSLQQIEDLRSALFSMPADDRDLWQRMGHALKRLGDVGRDLWLEWSATCPDKFRPEEDVKTWHSFKPRRTSYKAVFKAAQERGWVNPRKRLPRTPGTLNDDLGLIPASLSNPAPLNCEANAIRIIRGLPIFGDVYFDTFDHKLKIDRGGQCREWTDEDDTKATAHIQQAIAPRLTVNIVRAAIKVVARERDRDSLRLFVEGLPQWDGTARIENFFQDTVGAEDSAHIRAAGRNFLVSMMARALHPGCEVHFSIILESDQGAGKTALFKALAGQFYVETRASIETTDYLRILRGSWLVHMSELAAFRRSDQETVKERISANADEFVEKFERYPRKYLRRCVIVGSTNNDKYLTDPSGNRRFIPVRCGADPFRIDLVEQSRLQLFAEARHRLLAGQTWHEWPAETTQAQAERVIEDGWDEPITKFLLGRTETSIYEVLKNGLGLGTERIDRPAQTRVSETLRKLGWRKGPRFRSEGVQTTRYVRPE